MNQLLSLMKILADEAKANVAKNLKRNATILPPDDEDPLMARMTMLTKLYPVVKKKYDEEDSEKQ